MGALDGRIALVTGASRGIGRAIALELAVAGCDVAVNYRSREDAADEVVAAIRKDGRRAVAVGADVSRADEVKRLVSTVRSELGEIDILVNNAGIARPQPLEKLSEADWDETLATNLKSVFLVSQAVVPKMRARHWGRIVNLSSVAANIGGVVGPHYAASKAGILGLTHWLAASLAKDGVTANAISPALIGTEMVVGNLKARPDMLPVGRFGRVEEVASAVVMLASNGYITGQTIQVDGGLYMT